MSPMRSYRGRTPLVLECRWRPSRARAKRLAGTTNGFNHGSRRWISRYRLSAVTTRSPPGRSVRAISATATCGEWSHGITPRATTASK